MPTAIDTFRAQREAADGVYARLTEVSQLLHDLRGQAVTCLGSSDQCLLENNVGRLG